MTSPPGKEDKEGTTVKLPSEKEDAAKEESAADLPANETKSSTMDRVRRENTKANGQTKFSIGVAERKGPIESVMGVKFWKRESVFHILHT